MKIILDRPRCEGHGICEEVAPQLMHVDEAGQLVLDHEEVGDDDDDDLALATAAVRVCPVGALRIG